MEAFGKDEGSKDKVLAEELWVVLENSPNRGSVNEARRLRQKEVLKNLPADFDLEMRAAYQDEDTHVYGDLFECLVKADKEITQIPETELAQTIRSVLTIPEMYGLEDLGIQSVSNPDLAKIDESGKITGVVEAKARRFDRKSYNQLRFFRRNFESLLGKFKIISDKSLRQRGLGVIAENKNKLWVSSDFKITIGILAEKYNGDVDSLIKKDEFTEDETTDLKRLLSKCAIVESPFSDKEMVIMKNHINAKFSPQPAKAK